MVVSVEINGPVAVVTIDNPPVNAASAAVRQGLLDAVKQTEAQASISTVVLCCAGRTFIAGADIREFDQPPQEPHLPDVVSAIEAASKPWVAALHGTVLGGGLEVALACSIRIAAPDTRLGLPEVTLGLIPGAGGTVRLPRLIGAAAALDMISGGKPVAAKRALELGVIDEISEDLFDTALRVAQSPETKPKPLLERPIEPVDLTEQKSRITARARGQNSPIAAIKAVENALNLPPREALKAERAAFLALKSDPQSAALRHIFFAERQAGRMPETKGVTPRMIRQIGIIGGGTMGAGIASACLLAGLTVTLIERDATALEAGQSRVTDTLDGSLKRGLITGKKRAEMLERFDGSTDYAALSDADLVIEAVFEDMDVKHQVFAALDAATRADCVLASNTSYLDIDTIAQATKDPSRVIGLHFFSPAHIMKLLELVVTKAASPDVLATGFALGKALRKITVPAGVCDGFIGNRMMSSYRRVCDYLIEDGALPEEIDAAMRDYGFAMGVFEMQDLAGLDIAWAMRKRQAATRDPAQRYVDIPDLLCEQGRLGRKTGKGWYIYDGKAKVTDPEVTALILAEAQRKGITRRAFTPDEIMGQILGAMKQTGDALLAEGIARSSGDIDVVMVNGYAFPRHKGGPMFAAKPR